ncbi:MAG: hypothetical protein FJZ00_13410 [Candidatus Sericytochromatia bacterium]|uniref:Uncharacterized protein n=1 Tax=Candidatus Tanganyikabacteria bacterium TaxID=2961651 RepID=A0A937X881_9BACT|nr:hypothetical protein [Candidatus Tanganyikabacteria bacterium]
MPDKQQSTFGLKILALLMAVALWGFVGISQHHIAPQDRMIPSAAPSPPR